MKSRKKQNQIWKQILLSLVCGIIPFVMCIIRTAIDGKSILDVYLPNSTWNDELLYYKLTEACVHYGHPQGYFGFNESHALVGGFAAWSPVLLIPWVLWGLLFGWNLLSPILCNIAIMMLAMFVFGLIMKPNWKQVVCIAALYAAFPVMTRFTLSGMPEVNMYALLLVIVALMWDLTRRLAEVIYLRLVILYVLIALLTLMRPYYILLFVGFVYFMNKVMSGRKAAICSGCCIAPVVVAYGIISHYLSAPYLTELFYTDWLTAYKDGVLAALKYDVWKLLSSIRFVTMMMLQKTPEGRLLAGSLYFLFLISIALWLVLTIIHKKVVVPFIISLQMLILTVCFLGADLMMYRLQEGGRHTIAFIFVTIMLLPFIARDAEATSVSSQEQKEYDEAFQLWNQNGNVSVWKTLLPSAIGTVVLVVTFLILGKLPYEFEIPYAKAERVEEIEALHAVLEANIEVPIGAPSYENTIIWPIWDTVNGETVVFDWGMLYAVPAGMGINACDGGYVAAQMENLKCGYIATMKGSDVDKWGRKNGKGLCDNSSITILRFFDENP